MKTCYRHQAGLPGTMFIMEGTGSFPWLFFASFCWYGSTRRHFWKLWTERIKNQWKTDWRNHIYQDWTQCSRCTWMFRIYHSIRPAETSPRWRMSLQTDAWLVRVRFRSYYQEQRICWSYLWKTKLRWWWYIHIRNLRALQHLCWFPWQGMHTFVSLWISVQLTTLQFHTNTPFRW